jgi:hypothetical protein
MTEPTERDSKLESLIQRTLQQLPQRQAPRTLELRVHDELQRRAALPWWRRSFRQWPLPTRCAFIVACFAVMAFTIWTGTASFADAPFAGVDFADDAARFATWTHPAMALLASMRELTALLGEVIPTRWLHVGLGLGALFYLVLFGLGAAAYRTLYLQPSKGRC